MFNGTSIHNKRFGALRPHEADDQQLTMIAWAFARLRVLPVPTLPKPTTTWTPTVFFIFQKNFSFQDFFFENDHNSHFSSSRIVFPIKLWVTTQLRVPLISRILRSSEFEWDRHFLKSINFKNNLKTSDFTNSHFPSGFFSAESRFSWYLEPSRLFL